MNMYGWILYKNILKNITIIISILLQIKNKKFNNIYNISQWDKIQ